MHFFAFVLVSLILLAALYLSSQVATKVKPLLPPSATASRWMPSREQIFTDAVPRALQRQYLLSEVLLAVGGLGGLMASAASASFGGMLLFAFPTLFGFPGLLQSIKQFRGR